jgi:glycosyltransferase involved in cell wall biosynthesis
MKQQKSLENPLVSIIVVTFNSAKTVVETLESMKHQTYKNIELIVSDDCSTDNTVDMCYEWLKENNVRFVRTQLVTSPKNTGIAPNFNRGLSVAQGEWLKTIAGDDALFPYTIEEYINFIVKKPEVQFLHSNVVKYFHNFAEGNNFSTPKSYSYRINQDNIAPEEQFQILLRVSQVWAATVMFKRSVIEVVGNFDELSPFWEDRPMWLKITRNNIKLHYLNILGAKYRVNESSVQYKRHKKQLISNFTLQKEKYFLNNYSKFLPAYELSLIKIHKGRLLLIDKVGLNKNYFIIKLLLKISGFPLLQLINIVNKKYK